MTPNDIFDKEMKPILGIDKVNSTMLSLIEASSLCLLNTSDELLSSIYFKTKLNSRKMKRNKSFSFLVHFLCLINSKVE